MRLLSKVFRLQQIELQRMLFYSYQVGEDRFYQEVESIDELYKIVEQCLEEYNQTHKTQMNLVIFRYRPSFQSEMSASCATRMTCQRCCVIC